jgi:flavin-dependent dehydrogenase
MNVRQHDVIVVGGRCAGAATARLLADRGLDVVVLERASMPSDIHSTHGLARGAVVQLNRWGLLDDVLDTGVPAIRQARFGYLGIEQTRSIKARAGVDMLLAPRRYILDDLLLAAAARAGAEVRTRTRVRDVLRAPDGRVVGVRAIDEVGRPVDLTARWVIGADGRRSTIADLVAAETVAAYRTDVALFSAYVSGSDWPAFEFHVAPSSYAGVFPTNHGQASVWIARPCDQLPELMQGRDRTNAFVRSLDQAAPSVAARVRDGLIDGPVRGSIAVPNFVRRASGPGWALVGDAGYHRDPLTGHGITDAFRDAELLADAISDAISDGTAERSAFDAYETERNRALRDTFELTRQLARFPQPARFVELQMELSAVLEREALDLAARPAPAGRHAVTAA